MRGVARVVPRSSRSWREADAATWIAASAISLFCICGALYIGDRASRHLAQQTARMPRASLVAEMPEWSVNREKKAAREKGPAREAHFPANEMTALERWAAFLVPGALLQPSLPHRAPASSSSLHSETGRASWYQLASATASGERMSEAEMTAAHRTLPLGSYARVENLANGRVVIVRINDRGPFAKNRIIDLSKAAAKELGMIRAGVARVRVTPLGHGAADVISASAGGAALGQ
jgi:rare lipoprotein A